MAKMTASDAIRIAWKFNQPGLVKFIEYQESKAKLMSQQIEHCAALIEQQAQQIEDMKNCENCRHSYSDFGQDFPCDKCYLGRVNVEDSKWELLGK